MEKLCGIYRKIVLKIDETCAKVARTFHGCGIQIWPGFRLHKIYNNTKVVSVAVNHFISLDEFVLDERILCQILQSFKLQVVK